MPSTAPELGLESVSETVSFSLTLEATSEHPATRGEAPRDSERALGRAIRCVGYFAKRLEVGQLGTERVPVGITLDIEDVRCVLTRSIVATARKQLCCLRNHRLGPTGNSRPAKRFQRRGGSDPTQRSSGSRRGTTMRSPSFGRCVLGYWVDENSADGRGHRRHSGLAVAG